ncbi:hypothetical protein QBC44DRAFT_397126 [Cladorrhinum sp. PSN332]|nr:hypothetical protein QBC44DRAFT_397126 [Cladorrhinum sp. PSN332]
MDSTDNTLHRFWQRWNRGGLGPYDQVFSQLHLLHPKVLDKDVDRKVTADLIFVAGLGGHYRETWRAVDNTIWPQDLLHSEDYGVQDLRIWSFEYNTTLRGSSHVSQIGDHARELLGWIMIKIGGTSWIRAPQPGEAGTVQLKPIIFVGHSLGGMLIKKAMLIAETEDDYKVVWHATRGAMFFAVPHHGLDRADWKSFVTLVLKANAPVRGIRPTSRMEEQAVANGEALLGITHDFRRLQESLFFVNYSEGRLMRGSTVPIIAEGRGWMDAPRQFALKLDGDHLGLCKFEKPRERVTGDFETVVSHLKHLVGASKALENIGDTAKEALESLCPTGFHGYFMAKQATVGTCGWIGHRKPFQDWVGNKSESRMLWIQGPPASGKSYLTRHIIADLIPPSTTQKVAHCFLDDSVPGRRRLEHLLRATLHHALRVEPELIQHYLVPPYLKALRASNSGILPDDDIWTLEVLIPIWPEVVANVTSRGVLTVVVDGFSEMSLDCQQGFLDCLDDFKFNKAESQEQRDRLNVLLVSREDAEAQEQLEGQEEFQVYKIKPEDVQEDIEKTVMAAVTNPDNLDVQDPDLARRRLEDLDQDQVREIRDTIVNSSGGNFLLAKMKAEVISEALLVETPETTMALVKELPDDIAGMYDERLRRVQEDSTYLPFVRHLLRWAAFQKEPLKETEINTAVALGMAQDQASTSRVSKEKLETLQKLIGSTRSMVEKHARNLVEIREGALQPVDELLKERLTRASNDGLELHMEDGPSHAALANTCISYLTMDYFEDSHKPMADSADEKVRKRIEDHAFSRYAALYWKDHVEAAGSAWQGADDHAVDARRLLEDDTTHYAISCDEIRWFLTRKTMEGYRSASNEAHTTPHDESDEVLEAKPDEVLSLPSEDQQEALATDGPHDGQDGEAEASEAELTSHHSDARVTDGETKASEAELSSHHSDARVTDGEEAQPELVDILQSADAPVELPTPPVELPARREPDEYQQPSEPHTARAAEELEPSKRYAEPGPATTPQHRPLPPNDSSADLKKKYEPGSFKNRLQQNPNMVVPVLQRAKETPPRQSRPTENVFEPRDAKASRDSRLSQAYPTTSAVRREGRSTGSTAVPRRDDLSLAHDTRERPSLHYQRAGAGPAIRKSYDHTAGRESRGDSSRYQDKEPDGVQHEEPDSGAEESVFGDGTKKKKRNILRRALHKGKKIVKEMAKK